MVRHTQDERELKDGAILLYRRTDVAKPIWQCRIKFPDEPYIRRSLKTRNENEAVRKAEKLYDDLRFRRERGMPLNSPAMPYAIDKYLDWLAKEVEYGNASNKKLSDQRKFSRYIREFFEGKRVDQITERDIELYRDWRRNYWISGPGSKEKYREYVRDGRVIRGKKPTPRPPSASTLVSEDALLRAVFDRALRNGWVNGEQIPQIKSERPKANRRPDFTEAEIQKLLTLAKQRVGEAQNDRIRHARGMLECFVGLMAFTGMRPFEAMKLKWRDIEVFKTPQGKHATRISVSGKKKKRRLVGRDDVSGYVFQLSKVWLESRGLDIDEGHEPDEDANVFCSEDGAPVKSFKKGFKNLLDAAGLRCDADGNERDPYSFRHYYATQRILAGVSVYVVAENMGTSVPMIEKHYGHLKPELAADELTREIEAL